MKRLNVVKLIPCIVKNCENLGITNICGGCRANIYSWQKKSSARRLKRTANLQRYSDRMSMLPDVKKVRR